MGNVWIFKLPQNQYVAVLIIVQKMTLLDYLSCFNNTVLLNSGWS